MVVWEVLCVHGRICFFRLFRVLGQNSVFLESIWADRMLHIDFVAHFPPFVRAASNVARKDSSRA